MGSKIKQMFRGLFDVEPQERLKLFFLSLIYCLVIASYTITRDMKNSIFLCVVGKGYVPMVKTISMFILLPVIFFYSRLVDRIRRYQLLCFYSILFGIANLVFAYYIGDASVGILNTDASPWRLFGWFFYLFVEGYSPFVVSVFWALSHSINTPAAAQKNYGYMVAGSKLGGMFSAALAGYIFDLSAKGIYSNLDHVVAHRTVLFISTFFLLLVPLVTFLLVKMVPERLLHGYEAVYQAEKKQEISGRNQTGFFSGLSMFVRYPYVLGIFGMVFFYEIVGTVLSLMRLGIAEADSGSISEVSSRLFTMAFNTHFVGFCISLMGTQALLSWLGMRICLLLIPFSVGLFLFYLTIETTPAALMNAFVAFQAFHYAFSMPVRESLYLPTIKEIKFKSKSWIDAFGSKFAKAAGSLFNHIVSGMGSMFMMPIHSFFFATVVGLWFIVAFFLGKRFEYTIAHNEVIGADEEGNK